MTTTLCPSMGALISFVPGSAVMLFSLLCSCAHSLSLLPSLSAFDLADMGKNIRSKPSAHLTKTACRTGINCD